MSKFLVLIHVAVTLSCCYSFAVADQPAPKIETLTADHLTKRVLLEGEGFLSTQHVYFAVGDKIEDCPFQLGSDKKLVVAPPRYLKATYPIIILVRKDSAVAVTTSQSSLKGKPLNDEPLQFVKDGDIIDKASGPVFIENGGAVKSAQRAAIHFVKKGGRLDNPGTVTKSIFVEDGAMGNALKRANAVKAKVIVLCPIAEPIRFPLALSSQDQDAPERNATLDDGIIRSINLRGSEQIQHRLINRIVGTRDGCAFVALTKMPSVGVWNANSFKLLHEHTANDSRLFCLDVSPDSTRFAVGCHRALQNRHSVGTSKTATNFSG